MKLLRTLCGLRTPCGLLTRCQLIALSCLLLLSLAPLAKPQTAGSHSEYISGVRGDGVAAAYREGYAAFERRDLRAAAQAFERAYAINSGDDIAAHFIANIYALLGDKGAALDWLSRLSKLGTCFVPKSSSYGALGETPEYKALVKEIAARIPKMRRSSPVALPFPKGI
jgi:tetratricopeptide (TPR) repeat protein